MADIDWVYPAIFMVGFTLTILCTLRALKAWQAYVFEVAKLAISQQLAHRDETCARILTGELAKSLNAVEQETPAPEEKSEFDDESKWTSIGP